VVVVRGVLEITEGAELHGALLASRVVIHAHSRVLYSSCAVERALRAAAVPVVPRGQAWSEMH
jgi:carbonic anhydrase/acetyltransferase-like protein (isoleucine patch superfamily)